MGRSLVTTGRMVMATLQWVEELVTYSTLRPISCKRGTNNQTKNSNRYVRTSWLELLCDMMNSFFFSHYLEFFTTLVEIQANHQKRGFR